MSSPLAKRLAALAASKRAGMNKPVSEMSDAEIFGVKEEVSSGVADEASLPTSPTPTTPTKEQLPAMVTIESAVPTPKMTSVVDMENVGDYFDIKLKLQELEQALEEQVPGFDKILFEVHKALVGDPNVVTIFNDEEIGLVVEALKQHTNITVSVTAPKSSRKTQKFAASEL